jgi:hypothetical protein
MAVTMTGYTLWGMRPSCPNFIIRLPSLWNQQEFCHVSAYLRGYIVLKSRGQILQKFSIIIENFCYNFSIFNKRYWDRHATFTVKNEG